MDHESLRAYVVAGGVLHPVGHQDGDLHLQELGHDGHIVQMSLGVEAFREGDAARATAPEGIGTGVATDIQRFADDRTGKPPSRAEV